VCSNQRFDKQAINRSLWKVLEGQGSEVNRAIPPKQQFVVVLHLLKQGVISLLGDGWPEKRVQPHPRHRGEPGEESLAEE
jgi:hypothetical protein